MIRTLLVEDNPKFRNTVRTVLSTYFPTMTIEEAANGKEALDKLEAVRPEVVLMDIKLPGENGLKLTRRIKDFCPGITIVVLTTYDFPEYRQAALQAGANYFLTKGSSTGEEIAEILQRVASRNGRDRAKANEPKIKVRPEIIHAT